MADEMKIVITVDGSQAKATIAQVEQGLVSVTKAARAQTAVSNQQTAAWREEAAAQKAIGAEIQNSIHAKNLSAAASRAQAAASNSQAASLRQEAIAQRINAAATQAAAAEIGRETALKRQATAEIQNRIAQLRLQAAEERNATAAVSAHNREISHAASVTRTTAVSTNGFASALQSLGIAALGYKFITTMIQDTMALDSALARLSVASGTVNAEFQFIIATTEKLGTNLRASLDQFSLLSAATAGTALEGEQTRKMFVALSTAASALNMSTDQTAGIFRAFQQMASKGTVQMEELKGQLGDRLPGALNLAANAMGVTTASLIKMIEKGQVMSYDLLPKLADAMIHTYGDVALTTSQNARAQFNRLDSAVMQLMQTIGNSGPMQVLATTAGFLADHIKVAATVITVLAVPAIVAMIAAQIAARTAASASAAAALAQKSAEDLRALALQRSALVQQLNTAATMAGIGAGAANVAAIQREITAITAKQAALTAAAAGSGALRGALGLLGGPISWITTALTIGAAAWAIWGEEAKSALEQTQSDIDQRLAEMTSGGMSRVAALQDLIKKVEAGGDIKAPTPAKIKETMQSISDEIAFMFDKITALKTLQAAKQRELDAATKEYDKKGIRARYKELGDEIIRGQTYLNSLIATDKEQRAANDPSTLAQLKRRLAAEQKIEADAKAKRIKPIDEATENAAEKSRKKIEEAIDAENIRSNAVQSAATIATQRNRMRLDLEHEEELRLFTQRHTGMLDRVEKTESERKGGTRESGQKARLHAEAETYAAHYGAEAELKKKHAKEVLDYEQKEATSASQAINAKMRSNSESLNLTSEHIGMQFDLQIGAMNADRELKMERGVWTEQMERDHVEKRVALELEQVERITTIKIEAAELAHVAEIQAMSDELTLLAEKGDLTVEATEAIQARIEVATAAHKNRISALEAAEVKVHRDGTIAKQKTQTQAAKFSEHLSNGEYMSAFKMGESLLAMTGKSSKKMFEVKKAAGIATTVINGVEQISQAAKLPWPANIPAVAFAVADVVARVASIKAQQYEGGGGSAGGSAGAPATTSFTPAAPVAQPAAVQNPTLNITVNAPGGLVDPIVAQQLADSLAPHLQDAFNNGFNNVVTP